MPTAKKTTSTKAWAAKKKTTKAADQKQQWYQRHEGDTGSPEYQVYTMTQQILHLQGHLKANHKDYDAKRSLLKLVARRRQHMKYLKNNNLERYNVVAQKLWLK